jgi:hypothetical protein
VTVTDFSRLPLPSASVAVTHLTSGKVFSLITDKKGQACAKTIPEGLYSVQAGLTGFLYVTYHPVRVSANTPARLTFSLPIGEVTEGGIDDNATLSGTLIGKDGRPLKSAQICASSGSGVNQCIETNELGEYAFVIPAGQYTITIQSANHRRELKIDMSTPGEYRNKLSF